MSHPFPPLRLNPAAEPSPASPTAPASPAGLDGTAVRVPAEPPVDPSERRRSDRHAESASAWLSNAVGGHMTNGRTVAVEDLSLHGIGFSSATPCRVGDRHWVLVTRGPMRLSTRVKIARVRELPGGGWAIGGEFF